MFRVLHWVIVAEGVFLTLTGFQLGGGLLGVTFFPANNYSYHVMLGIAVIATVSLFVYDLAITGELSGLDQSKFPTPSDMCLQKAKLGSSLDQSRSIPYSTYPTKKAYACKIHPERSDVVLGICHSWRSVDGHGSHAGVPI